MNIDAQTLAWKDRAFLGLRWLLFLLCCAGLYLIRVQGAETALSALLPALLVGLLANALLTALIALKVNSAATPTLIVCDALMVAAFTFSGGGPLLVVGLAGGLMLSGTLRLNATVSAVQVAALVTITIVVLAFIRDDAGQSAILETQWLAALPILIGLGAIAVTGTFTMERLLAAQIQQIDVLAKGETEQMKHIREHSKAVYQLATTVGSTLDYDAILDSVLDAGRLALRDPDGQLLVSALFLFRASDNALHVAASRRMARSDQSVIIMGNQGVIGQTLREAAPIFADQIKKDPELQYFTSFNQCRSVLSVPLRSGYDTYGVVVYGSEHEAAFDNGQMDLMVAISSQVTIALQNAVLYRSLREEKERIVEVEEDARKKLARNLHDGPTQSVSAIAMRMSYIYRLMDRDPEKVPEELKKVEDLARKTAKEIRHMLFTLRPLVLETQGLTAALVQLAEKMQETYSQAVAVRMGRDVDALLDPQKQGVLFYIIEEAVNNARKHASAELISVNILRQEDMIVCQIADNGQGFDTAAVNTNYEKRGSLGMVNMRERVELLEGTMRIDSVLGKGTSVILYLPVKGAHNIHRDDGRAGRPVTKLALAAVERLDTGAR